MLAATGECTQVFLDSDYKLVLYSPDFMNGKRHPLYDI